MSVPAGFDPAAIKLIGNVTGELPVRGVLRHKGWRVKEVNLPPLPQGAGRMVIAPAEVELSCTANHTGRRCAMEFEVRRRFRLAAKYIVGIDLGTTNSALAFCDATASIEESRIEVHRNSAAGESERSGGTQLAAVISLHSGRIRFSEGQPRPAMGCRAEVCDRRTGAQTRRGESKPPDRLREVLALLCRGESQLRRFCRGRHPTRCPSCRRWKRHRSFCSTCARCGRTARRGSNTLWQIRRCCLRCLLRSTKKRVS